MTWNLKRDFYHILFNQEFFGYYFSYQEIFVILYFKENGLDVKNSESLKFDIIYKKNRLAPGFLSLVMKKHHVQKTYNQFFLESFYMRFFLIYKMYVYIRIKKNYMYMQYRLYTCLG